MRRVLALAASSLALAACGELKGFGGAEPPLVTFEVVSSGDLTSVRPEGGTQDPSLRVAVVWGLQWLEEAFCILPPESDAAAAVIAAGCRDPFSFVPNRVGTSVPVTIGEVAALPLLELPSADLMVGDITARVAYASLVLYDDRDGSGTLELSLPHRSPVGAGGRRGGGGASMDPGVDAADVIYGASFVTMTAPDQRVAYREGGFDGTSAFYPRSGCEAPPQGFSVLGTGGFTAAAALAATASGGLPPQDPATCTVATPEAAIVNIAIESPAILAEVGCDERRPDSSTRYNEPPASAPDLTGRPTACVHLPSFDTGTSTQSNLIQLVVPGHPTDRCKGLTHYTLRGCRQNVSCPVPDWDITATPPSWWPCPN